MKRIGNALDGLRLFQKLDVIMAEQPALAFLYDPRLGKTRASVRTLVRWIREGRMRKHVIVGPLTALEVTWQKELVDAGFGLVSHDGNHWGNAEGAVFPLLRPPVGESKGKWASAVVHRLLGFDQSVPIVVLVNDDVLHRHFNSGPRGGAYNLADLIIKWEPDSITLDESHRIKNPSAKRSEALKRMGRHTKFRRILTGTPNPNGPKDIFGQYAFLAPEIFGTSFADFKERYFFFNVYTKKMGGFKTPELEAEFNQKMRSVAHIVTADEAFGTNDVCGLCPEPPRRPLNEHRAGTPHVERIPRKIAMPEHLSEAYAALEETGVIRDFKQNIFLEVAHILPQFVRMQQLAVGYLPKFTETPEYNDATGTTWKHDEKLVSVVNDIREPFEAGQKSIISYRWKPEGDKIVEMLRTAYGADSVAELNGMTQNREEVIAPFNLNEPDMPDSPVRILVVQEATGGVGISLGRADHLHFLTWSFDYGNVQQMRKRTWHEKKKFTTETFHIMEGTIDEVMYASIGMKHAASFMVQNFSVHDMASGNVSIEEVEKLVELRDEEDRILAQVEQFEKERKRQAIASYTNDPVLGGSLA
jgi:hypothetical protein